MIDYDSNLHVPGSKRAPINECPEGALGIPDFELSMATDFYSTGRENGCHCLLKSANLYPGKA